MNLFPNKKFFRLACLILLLLFISGCGNAARQPITDVHDLAGRRIGVNLAWESDYALTEGSDAELYRYDMIADMLMALSYGKLDAIALDYASLQIVLSQTSGLVVLEPALADTGYVMYMNNSREKELASYNAFLADYKQGSQYQDLLARQKSFDGVHYEGDAIPLTGNGEELHVAIEIAGFPRAFIDVASGEAKGYDVEPLITWANENNYKLDIAPSSEDDMILGLMSGKYDIATGYLSDFYREDAEQAGLLVSDSAGSSPIYLCRKGDEPITLYGDVD